MMILRALVLLHVQYFDDTEYTNKRCKITTSRLLRQQADGVILLATFVSPFYCSIKNNNTYLLLLVVCCWAPSVVGCYGTINTTWCYNREPNLSSCQSHSLLAVSSSAIDCPRTETRCLPDVLNYVSTGTAKSTRCYRHADIRSAFK